MSADTQESSHADALKSTSIIGGSTMVVMMVRIIRTKTLALLLGPTGVGLEGIFDSSINVAKTLVDLGISSSGVRQIAAAVSTDNPQVIATTVLTLRKTCRILGVIGAVTFFAFRNQICEAAFGNRDRATDFGFLSLILLFGSLAGGQGALLQGMRRIGDLARMNIIGAIAGAVVSIPIVYFYRSSGIVAYMIVAALVAVLTSTYYVHRLRLPPTQVTNAQVVTEAKNLLKLGLVFVATGLMSTGALFVVRALVTRLQGLEGMGEFQAASALSNVYVGFVLQAMGTDFYPRLTAVAENNARCNQLVNEQAEVSILLALPGVLATIAAAPWVIKLFYSGRFTHAALILAWQVVGMFFQVNSWPMGFIIVAKGRAAAMFWTDFASYSLYVGLAWLGLKYFGLPGVGMAFVALYVFHWGLMYLLVRKISGFSWTNQNVRLSILGTVAAAITLTARLQLPEPWGTAVGLVLAAATGVLCLKTVIRHLGTARINRGLARIGLKFRLKDTPRSV